MSPQPIPVLLLFPFALLLLLIAAMPLSTARVKSWWERNYARASVALAALVVVYYFLAIGGGAVRVLHAGREYFSFISLIGSLFVVAGGIHLKVKGEATPLANVLFLLVAACCANVIGTTGASMVFIRPFIRMNKIRVGAYHVVFFIFLVANVGGALTPVGDPPLFLGYLRGVPFFWLVGHVLPQWVTTIALLLAAFYLFDRRSFRHAPAKIRAQIDAAHETWRFEGKINLLFLAIVVGAVFVPETWFAREALMLGAAFASYRLTQPVVHAENHFSFGPIREVAWLFLGIFATMIPALDYLEQHGQNAALTQPAHYYFASGALSSVLDNAPTYVNFLKLAQVRTADSAAGLTGAASVKHLLEYNPLLVVAVSLGSVFFGAMTYIGNGPNFMVKSIAHDAGVHTPSFFVYIFKYSLPVLLPILALTAWLFL